jgi:membrane-associated progesterone receptor component
MSFDSIFQIFSSPIVIVGVSVVLVALYFQLKHDSHKSKTHNDKPTQTPTKPVQEQEVDLSAQVIPDREFTLDELQQYKGIKSNEPVYVGVNGIVFDVTSKREVYGANENYGIFAGVEASRGLAKSSLNPDDLKPYGSLEGLNEKQLKTLSDWQKFYMKRYPAVGKIKMK